MENVFLGITSCRTRGLPMAVAQQWRREGNFSSLGSHDVQGWVNLLDSKITLIGNYKIR